MSLTNKTYKNLASLASQQEALNEFIFSQFDDRELGTVTDKLDALRYRPRSMVTTPRTTLSKVATSEPMRPPKELIC